MRRGRGQVALLLAPYVLGALTLVALPALVTFGLALTEWSLLDDPSFVGLRNLEDLLDDPLFGIALRNSLLYIALAVPLRLIAAVGLALLLWRSTRGVRTRRTAVYLPTVVPDVAYALLWLFLLNPVYGPMHAVLGGLGVPEPNWLTSPTGAMAAVVIMAVFTVGEGFVVALATRQELPEELYEISHIEGARPWYVLRRVTLPLMAPTLALLAFRDTALSLQATFVPALLVTGGGPNYATLFLPLLIYDNAFEHLRYGYAAAMTLTMFLLTALIIALQARVLRTGRFRLTD